MSADALHDAGAGTPAAPERGATPVTRRAAAAAARSVVLGIVSDGLGAGDPLPAEAVMAQRYGVGRASLREALRLLQVLGLVRIRTGRGGGPTITAVDGRSFARLTSFYLHAARATYGDLVAARLVMEPEMTRLGALRSSPEGHARLRAALAATADAAQSDLAYHRASGAFHDVVLGLSANAVLGLLARSLLDLFSRRVRRVDVGLSSRHASDATHEVIAHAVLRGDAAAADALMREHMLRFVDGLSSRQPTVLAEMIAWEVDEPASRSVHTWRQSPPALESPKISERIAARLAGEIEARGLVAGDRLESEARMALDLGVGRGSIREALRILEIYGLITLRRGSGGGPVVESPGANDFARVATLSLQRMGATVGELMEARAILEPVVARVAAEAPAERRARLAPLALRTQRGRGHAEHFFLVSNGFHAGVAEVCANPVLALYAGALRGVYADRVRGRLVEVVNQERVHRDHGAVAAAIVEGRGADAEALMREHLRYAADRTRAANAALFGEIVDWGSGGGDAAGAPSVSSSRAAQA